MALKYEKPTISFQSLSTNGGGASATCALAISFAEFSCPVKIPEWDNETIYTETNCDWSNDDGNICYHVPTATSNVFGS